MGDLRILEGEEVLSDVADYEMCSLLGLTVWECVLEQFLNVSLTVALILEEISEDESQRDRVNRTGGVKKKKKNRAQTEREVQTLSAVKDLPWQRGTLCRDTAMM